MCRGKWEVGSGGHVCFFFAFFSPFCSFGPTNKMGKTLNTPVTLFVWHGRYIEVDWVHFVSASMWGRGRWGFSAAILQFFSSEPTNKIKQALNTPLACFIWHLKCAKIFWEAFWLWARGTCFFSAQYKKSSEHTNKIKQALNTSVAGFIWGFKYLWVCWVCFRLEHMW